VEYILFALLGLLPFGLYRWLRSEEDTSDSYATHWEDDDSSEEDEDITRYSDTDNYYYSSISDTEDDTDPLTDPSYCFMEGNIYHDICHDDDHWDNDWDSWDDDW